MQDSRYARNVWDVYINETSIKVACSHRLHIDMPLYERCQAGLNSFQKLLREHERLLHHLALGEASKAWI